VLKRACFKQTFGELAVDWLIDYLQYVQSNEVGGSTHMEKAGLVQSLQFLKDRN